MGNCGNDFMSDRDGIVRERKSMQPDRCASFFVLDSRSGNHRPVVSLWVENMRTMPNFNEHLCPASLDLYPEPPYLEPISIAPSLLRPTTITNGNRCAVKPLFYTVFQYQVLLQWGHPMEDRSR